MNIFLTGYRGSGKTTVGRALADALGRPFVDVDDRIVDRAGKTIRTIFAEGGEPKFREIESAVIREIAGLDNHVIGLGGGALGRAENRAVVQSAGHHVIFLRCEPAELHRRIAGDALTVDNRPNLTKLGGLEEITALLAAREPIYRSVGTLEVDVTNRSPAETVARILELLKTEQKRSN
jgi:shikimate kinase